MARAHDPEVRAAAVAAVAVGEKPADVAKRFGISSGRLADWCKQDLPERSGASGARAREDLGDLVSAFVVESLTTLTDQARFARERDWLAKQTASGLSEYRGVELDRLIRLLAAYRPVDEQPAIDGHAVPANGSAAG
jgi:transposase-like protein